MTAWTPRELPCLLLVSMLLSYRAPGFRASVGFYPGGCYSLVHELVTRPLLVLLGDADDWTTPPSCVEMV